LQRGPALDRAAHAACLGITEDELMTELRGGSTLVQIGEAHGKTRADPEAFLVEQCAAKVTEILDAQEAQSTTSGDDTLPIGGEVSPEQATGSD
jgi:hypothetical protein